MDLKLPSRIQDDHVKMQPPEPRGTQKYENMFPTFLKELVTGDYMSWGYNVALTEETFKKDERWFGWDSGWRMYSEWAESEHKGVGIGNKRNIFRKLEKFGLPNSKRTDRTRRNEASWVPKQKKCVQLDKENVRSLWKRWMSQDTVDW